MKKLDEIKEKKQEKQNHDEKKIKESKNIDLINIAKNTVKNNPPIESKKSNKITELENFKKIPITSSNQIKQVKNYIRESLQEHLELIKKPEIFNLIEKDLNEEEKENVKLMIENIPDETLDKMTKKISNIYKSIKKIIKQTCEVDKKAKLKKLIINKEDLDKDLEIKAEEKLDNLIKIAEKEKNSVNLILDSVSTQFDKYCRGNELEVSESSDNVLIKKYDSNRKEYLIKHSEVTDYLIMNHNKNAENLQNDLTLKYDNYLKERLGIEKNFNDLYDSLDNIERKNSDLNLILKIQNNNENARIKRLKNSGLFI